MVQIIIFTETIIYKWSSLGILLILHLMVLANLYFQDIRSTQTLIFSPDSLFHFLHHSQQSCTMFIFFSFLWSLFDLRTFTLALVTNVPGVIIIILVLFGQSKAAYWPRWYKICVTKVFCIYKICFAIVLRVWLNGNTMFYETFVCFYVSEAKRLYFSLCSQMFNGIERCWIYNNQNVCHTNEQLSLCYFFSITSNRRLVGCSGSDNFMFTRETWKFNASFSHLIGRFYNDASSIRQTREVDNQKVSRARAETGKRTWNSKLVFLFKG